MTAIDSLSVEIHDGICALLGPNGAGKSSLLRVLATAQAPTRGIIRIFGDEVTAASPRHIRRRIGYLPQTPGLYPHYDVSRMVTHFALLKEIRGGAVIRAEVERVLDHVVCRIAGRHESASYPAACDSGWRWPARCWAIRAC